MTGGRFSCHRRVTREPSPCHTSRGHSRKAIQLVREFIGILEKIPDGCAELFPFELIDELKEEYLVAESLELK